MKNLFYLLFLIVCFGCNPNNPSPNSATMQWEATIDGQTSGWSSTFTPGQYPQNASNSGSSSVAIEPNNTPFGIVGVVNENGITKNMSLSLPTYAIGNYVINQSNYAQSNNVSFMEGNVMYSVGFGGSVTVNVTECPANIYEVVKCTFSGTIGKSPTAGGGTVSISGSFDAVKMN